MTAPTIRAEHLSKRYRIGAAREAYGTLRDAVAASVRHRYEALLGRAVSTRTAEIWALRDVSLEVERGEVLGIVGANGGGKTTLLKILSRVTQPTGGRAWIQGRVGSLLEVGTGFHPELTGRENIYLNGAILGMKRVEIDRQFDEIVGFAEIDAFLDTPVKRYSSGMYMRLAFSVAAHLEPEILLVDEVLAVGDAAFQRKSLGKMSNAARQGRTVMFVSHNMTAIQSLCQKVMWLHQGEVVDLGRPADVVTRYLQSSSSNTTEQVWADPSTAPGNDRVKLRRVAVRPVDGSSADPITMRTPVVLEFEFWNLMPEADLDWYVHLVTDAGVIAFGSSPIDHSELRSRGLPKGLFVSRCDVPGDLLAPGRYHVRFAIVRDSYHLVYQLDEAVVFEVQDAPELRAGWFGELVGVVRPLLEWTTELVDERVPGQESQQGQ